VEGGGLLVGIAEPALAGDAPLRQAVSGAQFMLQAGATDTSSLDAIGSLNEHDGYH
jgi:hypothetical protein